MFSKTKTLRALHIFKFYEYIQGIKYAANINKLCIEWYKTSSIEMINPSSDKKNYFHEDLEYDKNLKISLISTSSLKLETNSEYYEIMTSLETMFEQIDTLEFVFNHIRSIFINHLNQPIFFKKIEFLDDQYNKLFAVVDNDDKFKERQKVIKEIFKKEEREFNQVFITGKKVVMISQEIARYIELMLIKDEKYMSQKFQKFIKFRKGIYTEILNDIINSFQIPKEQYYSKEIIQILNSHSKDISKMNQSDFLTNIFDVTKANKEKNLLRLYETDEIFELWLEKIKLYAPMPDVFFNPKKIYEN